MKVKKIVVLLAAVSMLSVLFTGCGNSRQSEEEIVVPKEVAGSAGRENQDSQKEGETASVDGIAQMVQAPDHYTWEGVSGNYQISVDAPVIIPEAEGFKSYKVTSAVFTQEDYDKVNRVLLNGGVLWSRDHEAMEASNGFIASEIDAAIERLEKAKKAKGNNAADYDEKIAQFQRLRESAPEEPVLVDVPAVVSYQKREDDEEANADDNLLYGNVTVNGEDYTVILDNNLRDDWRWIYFDIKSPRGSYYPAGSTVEAGGEKISVEDVRQQAQQMMTDMGFTDFDLAGEEYFCSLSMNEESEVLTATGGYGFHFTRCLDGIPVTHTESEGTTVEDGDISSWPYERIDIAFDQDGFAEFRWTDPYHLEKTSDEYVFLLPFADIQNVFEEMMFKKTEDFWDEVQAEVTLQVNEVRLGYMRVMEKGNVMEGTMIPVWDFFGSETFRYGDMEEALTEERPYECLLTINAMDGTIIDRDLGY
ncbi:MAG: hypothetical protein K2N55_04215 [Lachnospiraceae bacterium]|nr:hypothetical protein [Lachnospiraceae bacterium]